MRNLAKVGRHTIEFSSLEVSVGRAPHTKIHDGTLSACVKELFAPGTHVANAWNKIKPGIEECSRPQIERRSVCTQGGA